MDSSSLAHCKCKCQYHMESKWDRSFWARGDYVSTVGSVDEETVKEYIQRQTEDP